MELVRLFKVIINIIKKRNIHESFAIAFTIILILEVFIFYKSKLLNIEEFFNISNFHTYRLNLFSLLTIAVMWIISSTIINGIILQKYKLIETINSFKTLYTYYFIFFSSMFLFLLVSLYFYYKPLIMLTFFLWYLVCDATYSVIVVHEYSKVRGELESKMGNKIKYLDLMYTYGKAFNILTLIKLIFIIVIIFVIILGLESISNWIMLSYVLPHEIIINTQRYRGFISLLR
jgi:hypothetical protein